MIFAGEGVNAAMQTPIYTLFFHVSKLIMGNYYNTWGIARVHKSWPTSVPASKKKEKVKVITFAGEGGGA